MTENEPRREGATDKPAKEVRPANQRGAARLAAVQALYQMDIAGTGLTEVIAEYETHRLGREIDGETYREADAAWFRSIVSGVVEGQRRLDPVIASALTMDWSLSRLDSTLRAILRAGTLELTERKAGDKVNLEIDQMARYAARLADFRG